MGKWHNYQFLKKRVAGERTPCPGGGVVPCLADASRTITRVWILGGGKRKKTSVQLFRVIGRPGSPPPELLTRECKPSPNSCEWHV
jgi:hypothetical protein